jgi:hypothetical protein
MRQSLEDTRNIVVQQHDLLPDHINVRLLWFVRRRPHWPLWYNDVSVVPPVVLVHAARLTATLWHDEAPCGASDAAGATTGGRLRAAPVVP